MDARWSQWWLYQQLFTEYVNGRWMNRMDYQFPLQIVLQGDV